MAAMDANAVIHPRFGLAWHEYQSSIKTLDANAPDYYARATALHDQFTDRILNAAESEAMSYYNLAQMQTEKALNACGPVPKITAQ
jgi:hypothetical protein